MQKVWEGPFDIDTSTNVAICLITICIGQKIGNNISSISEETSRGYCTKLCIHSTVGAVSVLEDPI